jgi:hypothetical protein
VNSFLTWALLLWTVPHLLYICPAAFVHMGLVWCAIHGIMIIHPPPPLGLRGIAVSSEFNISPTLGPRALQARPNHSNKTPVGPDRNLSFVFVRGFLIGIFCPAWMNCLGMVVGLRLIGNRWGPVCGVCVCVCVLNGTAWVHSFLV